MSDPDVAALIALDALEYSAKEVQFMAEQLQFIGQAQRGIDDANLSIARIHAWMAREIQINAILSDMAVRGVPALVLARIQVTLRSRRTGADHVMLICAYNKERLIDGLTQAGATDVCVTYEKTDAGWKPYVYFTWCAIVA